MPAAEGRGYVLRRILRRASRYAHHVLGAPADALPMARLVPAVLEASGGAFPELNARAAHVAEVVADEELAFASMLGRGVRFFDQVRGTLTTL